MKENDNLIKLVFCPANCNNFTMENEETLCDWDSHLSGLGGAQGTLVPQRQPRQSFLLLALKAGLSEPSKQQA